MDLKRAFETVDKKRLITKLSNYGIRELALNWIMDYLDNRKQVTKIKEIVSTETINIHGVPQGSTLGPLLFLIYINDIVGVIKDCKIHLFADDTLIYFCHSNLEQLVNTLNDELHNVYKWLNLNLLKLNVNKTKFMLISSNTVYNEFKSGNYKINVGNSDIEIIDRIKYLGFIVDRNLNFKEHAIYIINKISKNINLLSRLAPSLTQWSKITVYNTLILPHLTFGSSVLYLINRNELNRLQKLQNRAMRIILNVPKDTPIKTMLRSLDWLSVEYYIEYQSMILIYKMRNSLTPKYLTDKLVENTSVHNYNTRTRNEFHVMTKNKKRSERSIFHKGVLRYNELPEMIKSKTSLARFKTSLKVQLQEECYTRF